MAAGENASIEKEDRYPGEKWRAYDDGFRGVFDLYQSGACQLGISNEQGLRATSWKI